MKSMFQNKGIMKCFCLMDVRRKVLLWFHNLDKKAIVLAPDLTLCDQSRVAQTKRHYVKDEVAYNP